MRTRFALAAAASTVVAAVAAAGAFAHPEISPPIAVANHSQLYSLAVPTEKEGVTTTTVVLTLPAGFSIDSFVAAPGWKREVQQTGSGESAVIQKVTWSGGRVPTGEDSLFQFLGLPSSSKTYTFAVEQTYSDGSVVEWTGPESSDTPAPTVQAKSSLGGGSSMVALIALVVAGVAVVLAAVALVARGGNRQLA
jgi:uncharacterized protein YcnI